MLGRESIIDRKQMRASRGCYAPGEVAVEVRGADDEGSAMEEQDMTIGFGSGGGDQVRLDPIGVDGEGPSVRGRVRNKTLGNSHKPSMLLDRQLAMIAMLDQPAQAGSEHLGSHTHLTLYSPRSPASAFATCRTSLPSQTPPH